LPPLWLAVSYGVAIHGAAALDGIASVDDADMHDPDTWRLRVIIMAGQSNMEGEALVRSSPNWQFWRPPDWGTLERQCVDPRTAGIMAQACCHAGQYTVVPEIKVLAYERDCRNDDAGCEEVVKSGVLSIGFGVGGHSDRFGPELGFGLALRNARPGERFLLLKLAFGGSSLAEDWRPPSSTRVEDPFCKGACEFGRIGPNYQRLIKEARRALDRNFIAERFPDLARFTPELDGFVWFQGWTDGKSVAHAASYETNLVNLVRDVRQDLGAPVLPVVIGIAGFFGLGFPGGKNASDGSSSCWQASDPSPCECDSACAHKKVIDAQLASAALLRRAASAETRGFWRTPAASPSAGAAEPWHWNFNAESYFLAGQAMAAFMLHFLNATEDSKDKAELKQHWSLLNEKALAGEPLLPEDLAPASIAPKMRCSAPNTAILWRYGPSAMVALGTLALSGCLYFALRRSTANRGKGYLGCTEKSTDPIVMGVGSRTFAIAGGDVERGAPGGNAKRQQRQPARALCGCWKD